MLSRMVKQLVAAGLALAFMFTSALCLAAPNDKSDDTLPSVPDAESGTEHAAGVGVDYYGHADNAYFNGIGSDMTTKLKDMLSASVSSEYGVGIRFNMDEAMEEYDFSSDDLSGITIGIDPGHQLIADDELEPMPQIVVVIDELADLMLVAAKEVEESICRIAQMGRASGIHLVIATQRPSADVITGLMKANIPSRIAFAVASAMESRIILDTAGAEKLVGRGDMLYAPLGEGKPKRVQGCFISSEEIERVVNFVKENGETDYDESVIDKINAAVAEKEKGSAKGGGNAAPEQNAADEADELLPAAIDVVMETGQASVSMLQRRLKLGYSRAARIVDEMETRGIVGPFEGSKPRQLLITKEQWQELKMKGAYGATPPEAEELPPPDEEN